MQIQNSKSFRHFAEYLFIVGKVHIERNKAKDDIHNYLQNMKKSIIRMSLGYSDVDKLKEKFEKFITLEGRYAKFFKPEDKETKELKNQIIVLEEEVRNKSGQISRLICENSDEIAQLTESLNSIKSKMSHLLLDRAKRQQRMQALDRKINEKVDYLKR